jgi:hypothetical protein
MNAKSRGYRSSSATTRVIDSHNPMPSVRSHNKKPVRRVACEQAGVNFDKQYTPKPVFRVDDEKIKLAFHTWHTLSKKVDGRLYNLLSWSMKDIGENDNRQDPHRLYLHFERTSIGYFTLDGFFVALYEGAGELAKKFIITSFPHWFISDVLTEDELIEYGKNK